jgi:hypothetical protein
MRGGCYEKKRNCEGKGMFGNHAKKMDGGRGDNKKNIDQI